MKFTKEEAVEKLNQLLTNDGKKPLRMSVRTLESQVETLLAFVSDEEMELDSFVEKVKASLVNINSNMEKDQSDFIKDYQKKNPPQEANEDNPEVKKDKKKKSGEDPQGDLIRRLEELERKEQERVLESTLAAKREAIKTYLKDNNVGNDTWIDSMLGMIQVDVEDDSDEKGRELLTLYNKTAIGSPLVPGSPKPGGEIDPEHAFDDVKRALKARSGETS